MDLNTDLPGPRGIAGRATAHICCDPAFGFADQSARRVEATTELHVRCGAGARKFCTAFQPAADAASHGAFGWHGPYGRGEGTLFVEAACTAHLAAEDRDRFLEGCLKIQEDERLRLGRELHDSTGQLLLALRLNLAQLKRVHGTPVEDELIDEIEDTASRIDREIRSFAFLHYPAEIGRDGLGDTLAFLTRGFAARTGLKICFVNLCDRLVASGPASIALLRVAQEALTNVHRHARAMHVRVSLTLRDRLLELIVRDDGIGIPPAGHIAKEQGVGLLGMRHRIERLGGHFTVKRMKHGTKLLASVPLG